MSKNRVLMRALSLWRPWPTLILHGGVNVRTLDRTTTYRGRVIVHAGKTIDWAPWGRLERGEFDIPADVGVSDAKAVGFVGIVELVDVHRAGQCPDTGLCRAWGGRTGFHWMLERPCAFRRPIAGPGRQKLFWPAQQVLDEVATATSGEVGPHRAIQVDGLA